MQHAQQQAVVTRPIVYHLLAAVILTLAGILVYLPVSTAQIYFESSFNPGGEPAYGV